MRVGRKSGSRAAEDTRMRGPVRPGGVGAGVEASARGVKRRPADGPVRTPRTRTRPQEPRGPRQGPQSIPATRPVERPARPKTTTQAKARAKARKAKAPKAIRLPLRERLAIRISSIDFSPRALIARVPFVVLVIGALAVGLGLTLWLSTDAAQRSYQLSNARSLNDALVQQKEALERDVLEAQSAPALADAARNLGMIPSRDTAHLVQDPAGNWVVVGQPKAAQGAPPPPLNVKLPDDKPAPPAPPALKPGDQPVPPAAGPPPAGVPAGPPPAGVPAGPEVPVVLPAVPNPFSAHGANGPALPGPGGAPAPVGVPVPAPGDTLAVPPAGLQLVPVPTVAVVPPVTDVAAGVPIAGAAH